MTENKKSLAESIKDLRTLLEKQKKGGLKMMKAARMTQKTIEALEARIKGAKNGRGGN
jgi:hypothetical protein